MATIIEDEAWFCVDCGLIVANDAGSGIEDEAAHRAKMAAFYARYWEGKGYLVVSGCPEGDPCDFEGDDGHECRYDRSFSSVQCDGCGTRLAGHRFAGVVLA